MLFNDTLYHNLAYGDLDAPRERVLEAARVARLEEQVGRMSAGYDTQVGERGLQLSGGEKQRVAIARAVLKGAPVLLCDEATSSLDTTTEASIMSALKEVAQSRTTVMIAHRLTTVMDCDFIVVLDEGSVREQGTHDELLASRGLYASMWHQ